jgi:hypothetical protein
LLLQRPDIGGDVVDIGEFADMTPLDPAIEVARRCPCFG